MSISTAANPEMLDELRWKVSASATCLHAAACRMAGIPAANTGLSTALDAAADALAAELSAAGWPLPESLHVLAGLASEMDNNRQLVTRAAARLQPLLGDDATLVRLAGAISDLEAAMRLSQPQLEDELSVRVGPIREQWEAFGPGMLLEVARLTDEAIIPAVAETVLVAPYVGGHGMAHAAHNRVTFEAVLVNPIAELPEAVRLAWLISQLNSDLPHFSDVVPAGRASIAISFAMIPPVLAAAEAVELASCNESTISLVLIAWRLLDEPPELLAAKLWSWWNAWLDQSKSWPVAVAALDRMLAEG
jgi:hypothetical protein